MKSIECDSDANEDAWFKKKYILSKLLNSSHF